MICRQCLDKRALQIAAIVFPFDAEVMIARDGKIGDFAVKLIQENVETVPLFLLETVVHQVARLDDIADVERLLLRHDPFAHRLKYFVVLLIGNGLRVRQPHD
ncbi:hypothetical protein SDC9_186826 [bioreactor metagenome]|uniref:Uncharacterized protein n=1 Tax=bioreactor metagenome TaxID=1076179 RepID=A0A645HJV6_9ZZZZ